LKNFPVAIHHTNKDHGTIHRVNLKKKQGRDQIGPSSCNK